VVAAPIMLASGAPAGWSFLVLAVGIMVLTAQWVIATDVRLDAPSTASVVLCVVGMVCVGVAIVYLTRAADDLPRAFPGYDGDSETFRLIPGVVTLIVGVVALGRAVASVHPTRHARP
jgi:drug/metabolite transporter (DMT)-like permease